jgi:hypothetical protein
MAAHEVQYETATGNDYPEHEATYEGFVHLTAVGIFTLVTVLVALTVGGVLDHWAMTTVFVVLAIIGLAQGLLSGSVTFSAVITLLALLSLAFYGLG